MKKHRIRRTLGVATAAVGMLVALLAMTTTPAAAFEGSCTPAPGDASSGVCVLDETNGSDPSTWGTMTYSRVGDVISFEFDQALAGTSLLACFSVGTAFPTSGQPCVGSSNPQYNAGWVDPLVVDLADPATGNPIPNFDSGDPVYFAIHVNQGGRTTYGIGGLVTVPETRIPPPATPVPGASAVDCAAQGAPGIVLTLTNTGDADAVFTVTQDGLPVGDLEARTVTPAEDTETLTLPQVEDIATTVVVTLGEFSKTFDFASNCSTPSPATPVPGASAVDCAAQGAPGIVLTLTNTGDADAVFTVTQDGLPVGDLEARTVTPAEDTETLTLPQVEDIATTVVVTLGEFSKTFDFASNCSTPSPVETEAVLGASIACGAGGVVVTITNTGDAVGTVDVLNNDAVVADDLEIAAAGSEQVTVTVADDVAYDIEVTGVESFIGTRECEDVLPNVISKAPVKPTEVAGVQVARGTAVAAQQLPRTGGDALPLVQVGLGLMLMGAGALLVGKERTASI